MVATLPRVGSGKRAAAIAATKPPSPSYLCDLDIEDVRLVDPAIAYILETEIWFQDKTGEPVKFVPTPIQWKFLEAVYEHRKAGRPVVFLILKARQMGVSSIVALYFYACMRVFSNISGVVVADKKENAEEMFRQKYLAYATHELSSNPRCLRQPLPASKLLFRDTKSQLRVVTANKKAGVGSTGQLIHLSEFGLYANAAGTWAAIKPSMPKTAKPGVALVVESTGGGVEDDFAAKYWSARQAEAEGRIPSMTPFFWNWLLCPEYAEECDRDRILATLTDYERMMIDEHGATCEQIQWRRTMVEEMGEASFREQYPLTDEEAFGISSKSIFKPSAIQWFKDYYVQSPLFCADVKLVSRRCDLEIKSNGPLWVHRVPQAGGRYTINVDPQALDPEQRAAQRESYRSDSGVVVLDEADGEECATWLGQINPWDMGGVAVALAKYYNAGMITVEVNQSGGTVLKRIREEGYTNLYLREAAVDSREQHTDASKIGWLTNHKSRDAMLDLLEYHVNELSVGIRCERLLRQLMTFVKKPGGRRAARTRKDRDELPICLAIGIATAKQRGQWRRRDTEEIMARAITRKIEEAEAAGDIDSLLGWVEKERSNRRSGAYESPLAKMMRGAA